MNENTPRSTRSGRPNPRRPLHRSSVAVAATLLVGGLALGACSKTDAGSALGAPAGTAASAQQVAGNDTIDLVDAGLVAQGTPAADTAPDAQGRHGGKGPLRDRLVRALHATWVTQGQQGTVTHQAIRGDVTAVSATSITVKARDGVSMTFTVTKDTKVRERSGGKGADASLGAAKVGDKALVMGVGASNPQARVVVFKDAAASAKPSSSPSPSATS